MEFLDVNGSFTCLDHVTVLNKMMSPTVLVGQSRPEAAAAAAAYRNTGCAAATSLSSA